MYRWECKIEFADQSSFNGMTCGAKKLEPNAVSMKCPKKVMSPVEILLSKHLTIYSRDLVLSH